jgi:hypothetical protein
MGLHGKIHCALVEPGVVGFARRIQQQRVGAAGIAAACRELGHDQFVEEGGV